jgi:TadE-like protein
MIASLHRREFFGRLRQLAENRRGGVLVETAFALPVLAFLLLGCIEMAQYLLVHQKLDRAAATMADLVSQPATISAAEVDQLFDAADHVLEPFDLADHGRVIVTSISREPDDPTGMVDWQREGGGSLVAYSKIGVPGGPAEMPDGFEVREGENLIAAEIFFEYEPLFFTSLLHGGVVWHNAYRRSRLGALSTIN